MTDKTISKTVNGVLISPKNKTLKEVTFKISDNFSMDKMETIIGSSHIGIETNALKHLLNYPGDDIWINFSSNSQYYFTINNKTFRGRCLILGNRNDSRTSHTLTEDDLKTLKETIIFTKTTLNKKTF